MAEAYDAVKRSVVFDCLRYPRKTVLEACVYDFRFPFSSRVHAILPSPPPERRLGFFIPIRSVVVARDVGRVELDGTRWIGEVGFVAGKSLGDGLYESAGFGMEERARLCVACGVPIVYVGERLLGCERCARGRSKRTVEHEDP